jgi:hypothetical protein
MNCAYIKAGYGYQVGQDLNRAAADTPIGISVLERGRPGYLIGYIAGDPSHPLAFMRSKRVRVHVPRFAIGDFWRHDLPCQNCSNGGKGVCSLLEKE